MAGNPVHNAKPETIMTDREFKVICPDGGRGVVLHPPTSGFYLFSAVVMSVGCFIRPTLKQYGVKTPPSRDRKSVV